MVVVIYAFFIFAGGRRGTPRRNDARLISPRGIPQDMSRTCPGADAGYPIEISMRKTRLSRIDIARFNSTCLWFMPIAIAYAYYMIDIQSYTRFMQWNTSHLHAQAIVIHAH